jgi:hypothetical protein
MAVPRTKSNKNGAFAQIGNRNAIKITVQETKLRWCDIERRPR